MGLCCKGAGWKPTTAPPSTALPSTNSKSTGASSEPKKPKTGSVRIVPRPSPIAMFAIAAALAATVAGCSSSTSASTGTGTSTGTATGSTITYWASDQGSSIADDYTVLNPELAQV